MRTLRNPIGSMFSIGNSITDNIFQENLENTSDFFIDQDIDFKKELKKDKN